MIISGSLPEKRVYLSIYYYYRTGRAGQFIVVRGAVPFSNKEKKLPAILLVNQSTYLIKSS